VTAPAEGARRTSPRVVLVHTITFRQARQLVPLVIPLAAATGFGGGTTTVVVLVIAVTLLSLGTAAVSWSRFSYADGPAAVVVTRGLLARSVRTVPNDRIRGVEVEAPPLHRLFGLVRVRIDAAAGAAGKDEELLVDGVVRAEGDRLRTAVLTHRSTPDAASAEPEEVISEFDNRWLLYAPLVGTYLAVPLAALAMGAVGLGVERTTIRPMIGRPVFVIAIITLGLDVIIRVITNIFIGRDVRQVGDPWGLSTVDILGITVQQRYIAMMIVLAVVGAALFVFFRYSRYGLAMRAASLDQETALVQGISVGGVMAMSWAMAGGLAAIAGAFVGTGGVDQSTWIIALKALPAIIIGGLDSIEGAVVGGLLVGVVEAFFAVYQDDFAPWLGQNFALVSPYVLLLLVLLVKPYGFFGTREVERV